MRGASTLLAALAAAALASASPGPPCKCSNATLCKPLAGPAVADREFFMFATAASQNWELYPWERLTTVAVAGWDGVTSDMVCRAHASSTRLVILTSMPKDQVANATLRSAWVASTVASVRASALDGVNVDFEDFVLAGETAVRDGLVALTKELRAALDAAGREDGGAYQLSWDFAWSPDGLDGNCGIDERCYPYAQLAALVDVGFVMAYDMRSQVFGPGPCRAYANSPRDLVADGMTRWAAVAASSKLVLGLPLYGYRYTCLPGTDPAAALCPINTTLWRNATCSGEATFGGMVLWFFVCFSPAAALTPPPPTAPPHAVESPPPSKSRRLCGERAQRV